MIFSETRWIKSYAKKMDTPLKKELLNIYKHSRLTPCFFHKLISKIHYSIKKIDVIIKYSYALDGNDKKLTNKIIGFRKQRKNHELEIINSYYARLTAAKIMKLVELDAVEMIYLDRGYRALLNSAGPSMQVSAAWDNQIIGSGITTAVIDTGIYAHDDLTKPKNRILAFKDFVKNRKKTYDDNGHGTHVAGAIASNGSCSKNLYKAPAYGSSLVGVKVLDKFGTGNLSKIILGIQWCIENKSKYNIRIICMSLGSVAAVPYKDDLLCEAVEAAWNSGIVVCVAAGNEGPEYGTISSPGIDPVIITVGAADDKNTPDISDDTIANFSSRGPTIDGFKKPDVIAPGVNIISLRSPGSYLDRISKSYRVGNDYFTLSGTSMATPLCCSAIAILLEKNPEFTPNQVKVVLMNSAVDIGYDGYVQGSGYVNLRNIAISINNTQDKTPPHNITKNSDNHQTDVFTHNKSQNASALKHSPVFGLEISGRGIEK